MFSMEEFIITVFCCVDAGLAAVTQGRPIRTKGFAPALSASEVLTMELVAAYQGLNTDQAIWQYFRRHWLTWFPGLGSRRAFVRQAANLWQYKALLQHRFAVQLGAFNDPVHLVDGIPIPLVASVVPQVAAVCQRHCRLWLLCSQAADLLWFS
jgi:hypothetical protein